MMKLIFKWVIFAIVIMALCYLPGIEVESFWFAMLVAAVLTFVNIFIKPIVKLLTFPINLVTLGLFNIVINIGMLYLTAFLVPQFEVENFLSAFLASIVIAVSSDLLKRV
ncbi:phage holin family protein [bacterium]|nr:phage holin family protein [bacterium]